MLQQRRYLLALGTAAAHLLGSLLLTIVGLHNATFLDSRSRLTHLP